MVEGENECWFGLAQEVVHCSTGKDAIHSVCSSDSTRAGNALQDQKSDRATMDE